jgi:hypothetical protein
MSIEKQEFGGDQHRRQRERRLLGPKGKESCDQEADVQQRAAKEAIGRMAADPPANEEDHREEVEERRKGCQALHDVGDSLGSERMGDEERRCQEGDGGG